MTTTTTHFYCNTIVDQPMTCAAVTCTSVSASGTFSCGTYSATCGDFKSLSITASGTFSAASITSSGSISCGTNAMTCGALKTLSITASGTFSAAAITSSGTFSCGANAMTCGALACSSANVTGTISCGTYSATCGDLKTLSITASGTFSAASITSSGTFSCGANAMTCGALACASANVTGTISCGTYSATCGDLKTLSITASGTFSAASITSSGTFSCGANSMTCGALVCNSITSSGRITSVDIVCSSGILCNNFSTNLLGGGGGVTPRYNSTTLSWSWTNSTGQTYLINQRGTGAGGFSFGLYDGSNNGYVDPSGYSEFLTIAANFNSSAGARAGRTYLQTPLHVYGHGDLQPSVIGTFYSPSLLNTYYNEIQVGRGGGSYENALFAYCMNTGTTQASFGEIDIAGAGTTITFDGYARVGVGQVPDATNRLAVNGNITSSNVCSGSFSADFNGPWSAAITGVTIYWARSGNIVNLLIPYIKGAGSATSSGNYIHSTIAVLPTALRPTQDHQFSLIPIQVSGVGKIGYFEVQSGGVLYAGQLPSTSAGNYLGFPGDGATQGVGGSDASTVTHVVSYLLL